MIAGFTAVNALRTQEAMVDVAANNLANVQTPGFKASRVNLQTTAGGSVETGSITRNTGQGPIQLTGVSSDLAIEGPGYFSIEGENGELFYSRSGGFTRDADGFLRHPSGGYLASGGGRIQIPQNAVSYSIERDGTVRTMDQNGNSTISGTVTLTHFQNENGLESMGQGLMKTTPASGGGISGNPGVDGMGSIFSGGLEMSNTDMASELVDMIIAQRAFEANLKVVSTSNEMLRTLTRQYRSS